MESISVVIPTYNASRFISETLASVNGQSDLPDELIIVDDASTDDTCERIRQFSKTAPLMVRLIERKENSGGPALPMNLGVQHCRTSLFTILDHDDLLCHDAIASYRNSWARISDPKLGMISSDISAFSSAGLVYASHFRRMGGLLSVLESPREVLSVLSSQESRQALCHSMCIPAKAVFSKTAWASVGGFTTRFRSLWDCAFLWAIVSKYRTGILDRVLVKVRIHPNNLSGEPQLVAQELVTFLRLISAEIADRKLKRHLHSRRMRELFDLTYMAYKNRSITQLCRFGPSLAWAKIQVTY